MITPQSFIDASNKERWEREYKTAWLIVYQGLLTMDNHPRNDLPASARELAEQTDYFIKEFTRRFPCPQSSQAHSSQEAPHSAPDSSADSHNNPPTKQT